MIRTLLVTALLAGCAQAPRYLFEINVLARSDNGERLGDVTIKHGPKELGKTTTDGRLVIKVDAADGSTFPIHVQCPDEYTAIRDSVAIPLRTVDAAEESTQITIDLECRPKKRTAVVVVKTNMAGVPVLVDNQRVGATNEFGVAHIAMDSTPNKHFYVKLDTSQNSKLWPENPIAQFAIADRDQLFTVNETFEVLTAKKKIAKKKRRKKVKKAAARPTKVTGGGTFGTIKRSTKTDDR